MLTAIIVALCLWSLVGIPLYVNLRFELALYESFSSKIPMRRGLRAALWCGPIVWLYFLFEIVMEAGDRAIQRWARWYATRLMR